MTIAGNGIESKIIHPEDLASVPLPRAAEWQHLAREQEMILDSLRNLLDQGYLRQVMLASSSQAILHHPPDKYTLLNQQRAGQGGPRQ